MIDLKNNISPFADSAEGDINYPAPFAVRVWKFSKLPWWLMWTVFWVIILAIDYLLENLDIHSTSRFQVDFGITAFFLATIIGIGYCAGQLKDFYPFLSSFLAKPVTETKQWYNQWYISAYSEKRIYLISAIFSTAVIAGISPMVIDLSQSYLVLILIRVTYLWVGFFMVGMGLWALIEVTKMSIELSKFPVKVTLHRHPDTSVLAVGRLFFRLALSVAAAYSCVVITVMISPYKNSWLVIGFLALGAGAALIFFLIPQTGVHKCMVREKYHRISVFSEHLEKALDQAVKNPSQDNVEKLKDLIELQNYLNTMNEWPFDGEALWSLITALIFPLVLAIIQILWTK